jgi:predicted protein tyrosine phosphatase
MMSENQIEVSKQFDLDEFSCLQFILDIPDCFNRMHPRLIERLEESVMSLPFAVGIK